MSKMPWDSFHDILSSYTLNFIKLNLIPIIYDKLAVNSIWWCDIISNVMPTCHIWQVDVRFNMVWKYDVMWKLASDLVWCDKKCFLTPSQNNSLKIGIYIAANTQTFSHAPYKKKSCCILNLMVLSPHSKSNANLSYADPSDLSMPTSCGYDGPQQWVNHGLLAWDPHMLHPMH